jgi:MFS family permease
MSSFALSSMPDQETMAPSYLSWLPRKIYSSNYELPFRRSKSLPTVTTEVLGQTSSSQPESPQEVELPNDAETTGTKRARLQVLVNHLVMLNSFGLIQSFGIFQLPYEVHLSSSPSTVAWIGSIHIFFVYFLGTFSGWALDRGYYKRLLFVGSALQIIGLLVAGFSKTWWMTFLFHGVFQGIGHGLMFCPAVTMTAVYFNDSRMKMTALGIAGCGASTGGILFPLIARYTINTRGSGDTLWIMCGVVTFVSILIQLLANSEPRRMRSDQATRTSRSNIQVVEWQAFKEPSYALYVVAMFFVFVGLWIPFFYVREFSAKALHITKPQSFIILIVLNTAGIPGRIIPALLSDCCIGTINTYIVTLLLTSITLLCWPLVHSATGMIPWALAYGYGAGGVSSLLQAGITSLNDEPNKTGIKIGMAFSIVGFASLLGGPVGGELIRIGDEIRDKGADAYVLMMVFTGSIMMLGCGILCIARLAKTGYKLKMKV